METKPNDEEKLITVDSAISYVGEFNKFQWMMAAMFCIVMFPTTFQILIMVFTALEPDWRCVANSTHCIENGTFSPLNSLRCTLPRSEWEYTQSKDYSMVTYFDIYCDDSWLIQLSSSMLFWGWCIGGIFVGWTADNYGRKKTIYTSIVMVLLFSIVTPFMPNIYLVMIMRFMIGLFMAGTNQQMAMLLTELVASKYRPHAGIIVWVFFSVALCVLSLKAYFIRNWKVLFIVCTAPYIFIVLFYKFTPESPRWLSLKGRLDELMQLLENIARVNKATEPPSAMRMLPVFKHSELQKSNPTQLFSSFKIAKITLIIGFGGFANGMTYYGLSMAARDLGGSLYLNFFLLSLAEIPATVGAIFICDRFGRKYSTIMGICFASISCFAVALLPKKIELARIIVGMFGKLSVAVSFNTLAIWITELFPTVVRGQAMGVANFAVRIGAGATPWVISGFGSLHPSAPYISMSVVALISTVLSGFLSETNGLPTLETMEDITDEYDGNNVIEENVQIIDGVNCHDVV